MQDHIFIKGARENNLKNIDVTIPRDKLEMCIRDRVSTEGRRPTVHSSSHHRR